MKKRIFLFILSVLMTVSVMALTVSAKSAGITKLVTSRYAKNNVTLELKNNTMNVSALFENGKINYMFIFVGKDTSNPIPIKVSQGKKLTTSVDLSKFGGVQYVQMYIADEKLETAESIYMGNTITIVKENGKWYFNIPDDIYESNKKWMSGYVNVEDAMLDDSEDCRINDAIKKTVDTLTAGLSSDYDKAFAIHKWVSYNLFYDYDYTDSNKNSTSVKAADVYNTKISVCQGFANLEQGMLHYAGIPAIQVKGISRKVSNKDTWEEVANKKTPNHVWIEFYADGRWVFSDPTWDCRNIVAAGQAVKFENKCYVYFDCPVECVSSSHFIVSRPNTYGYNDIDSWALEECEPARTLGLIIPEIKETMKDNITRKEFCELIINMILKKDGKAMQNKIKDLENYLNENSIATDESKFSDISGIKNVNPMMYYSIIVANSMGIVNGTGNGKFSPDEFITRQDAATMLMRVATKVYGMTSSGKSKFADENEFGSWAVEGIDFCSATASKKSYKNIMGGIGNGKFGPRSYYTKEQSVLTIYRLYYAI